MIWRGRAGDRAGYARPARIGRVFEPSAEMLRLAVEQATLLWGGQYQPFFRPGDLDRIERWRAVDGYWNLPADGHKELPGDSQSDHAL